MPVILGAFLLFAGVSAHGVERFRYPSGNKRIQRLEKGDSWEGKKLKPQKWAKVNPYSVGKNDGPEYFVRRKTNNNSLR